MRTIVRSAIINDPALVGMGVKPEGVVTGDVDTPLARPFLNLKWGLTLPSFRGSLTKTATLVIWVHNDPSDYGPIDRILTRLQVLLPSIEGSTAPDGSEVQVIDWLGDGPDLQDDGHRTIVKVGNYRVVGKS